MRGILAYVMIAIITFMALVNFVAPFFTDYKTDPLITYFFLVVSSSIAGYKGLAGFLLNKAGALLPPPEERPEKREE